MTSTPRTFGFPVTLPVKAIASALAVYAPIRLPNLALPNLALPNLAPFDPAWNFPPGIYRHVA
ncbi:MAG: hypothetical protein Fur0046_13810 [Cyanobacteria bacterium J069]|nr:MAG: hypothetical protein D6742_15035 [Cyanobacteria bacterium J069]